MKNFSTILFFLCLNLFSIIHAQTNCDHLESLIHIEIQTDYWAYETSWTLSTSTGEVYLAIPEGTYANGETYIYEACIPYNECNVFTLLDNHGDGGPNYSISLDGDLLVEKQFNSGFLTTFEFNCLPGNGCGSPITITEDNHIAAKANSWYAFTPDSIGTYLISTCDENNGDTKIWIYDDCPPFIDDTNEGTIYYNDDFCASQASIENAILDVGKTYIIRIGGNNLEEIDEEIHFSISYNGQVAGCTNPASCNYKPLATIDDGSCLQLGHPNCPNAPDLVLDKNDLVTTIYLTTIENTDECMIAEGCIQGYGQRDIVRFTTTIHNYGDADYVIGAPSATSDQFTYDNCHNHYHYDGYAEYILFDEEGTEIPIGFKNGFCVIDLYCSSGAQWQYGCNYMGISAGCSDIYDSYLDCQWIDITDVADGTYTFVTRVNWDNAPDALGQVEKNSINNWAQVCITLSRSSGVLEMFVDPDCPIYVDCTGEPFGSAQPDCTGECNGSRLTGDLDLSGNQSMDDAIEFTNLIFDGSTAEPCNDLNADGQLTIYDATLLSSCVIFGESHPHFDTGPHDHCKFPSGVLNPNDNVQFSIMDADFEGQYIDIGIMTPDADIVAYQFQLSGVMIQGVENLVDESDYNIAPKASVQQGMILGISYENETITRSMEMQSLVRVYYSSLTGDSICISQAVEAVNHNYEQTLVSVGGNCLSTNVLSIETEAQNLVVDCSEETAIVFQNWLNDNGGASAIACGDLTWSYSPENPELPAVCGESLEVLFTANDPCSPSTATIATFSIVDNENPSFTSIPSDENDTVEAIDNCDEIVDIVFEDTTGDSPCETIRIWTATDDCGNSSTAMTVLNIGEMNPPIFNNIPENITIDCSQAPIFGIPSASDAEGGVTMTSSDRIDDNPCEGVSITTRIWTATDDCGNVTTASQTITSEDNTSPVFTSIPMDLTFFCDEAIDFPQPTTNDDCGSVTITFTEELNDGAVAIDCNNGLGYNINRTWMATDACGNSNTAETTAWVVPTNYTGPVFDFIPENRSISCGDSSEFGDATCISACGNVSLSFIDVINVGNCNTETTYTRTWTGIDDCGNVSTATQILTIPTDVEAPSFSFIPENETIACDETPIFGTPVFIDNCAILDSSNVTFEDVELTEECAVQRIWTVTDVCGNVAQASQKITINDQDAPVFSTISVYKQIDCDADYPFDEPIITDDCSTLEITIDTETAITACSDDAIRTRTWTATDACGNVASISQTISREDVEAPIIETALENQVIPCGVDFEFIEPQISDACNVAWLEYEDEVVTGDCNNNTTFKRIWMAIDACGNVAQTEQTFTIQLDEAAPEFSAIPENKTINCGEEFLFENITATDICSEVEITVEDEAINTTCEFSFSTKRTWRASDACGNTNEISQIITVEDEDAPEFTFVPEGKILDCEEGYEYGEPAVIDGCSTVELSFEDVNIFDTCNGHSFRRVWTATDACGNASQAIQEFTSIPDTEAPIFSMTPENKVISCLEEFNFSPLTAIDICTEVELNFEDETIEGICENSYSIRRTWTATDVCGNAATISQIITLEDVEAPVFETVLENKTLSCVEDVVFDTPSASDSCSEINLTFEDNFIAGNCPNAGIHQRIWTARDACANISTTLQEITIEEDNTPPTILNPISDKSIECGTALNFDVPIVEDDCSEISIISEDTTESLECGIAHIRTWTIADACGNNTIISQKIEEIDTEAPTFIYPPTTAEISAEEYTSGNWSPMATPAEDNCSEVQISDVIIEAVPDCEQFVYNYSWEATDACGNIAVYPLKVIIYDALPTVEMTVPEEMECGNSYPIDLLINGGYGTFEQTWTIESNSNWMVDTDSLTLLAGEGEATLTLTMINEYDCLVEQSIELTCQVVNNIVDLEKSAGFSLAPNPTSSNLTISFTASKSENAQLEIYNQLGQSVYQESFAYPSGDTSKTINLHSLSSGMYLLMVQTKTGQWTEKFIKID